MECSRATRLFYALETGLAGWAQRNPGTFVAIEGKKPDIASPVANGCTVGNDSADLALPGVAVAIDQRGDDDRARDIEDDCIPALSQVGEVGRPGTSMGLSSRRAADVVHSFGLSDTNRW
jgi:hypothetical protein